MVSRELCIIIQLLGMEKKTYTKDFLSLLLVGAFLPFTRPVCNLAWLFAGVKLQKLFQQHRMVISLLMALSLVYCAISLVS